MGKIHRSQELALQEGFSQVMVYPVSLEAGSSIFTYYFSIQSFISTEWYPEGRIFSTSPDRLERFGGRYWEERNILLQLDRMTHLDTFGHVFLGFERRTQDSL